MSFATRNNKICFLFLSHLNFQKNEENCRVLIDINDLVAHTRMRAENDLLFTISL